jgi:hypothetical protein
MVSVPKALNRPTGIGRDNVNAQTAGASAAVTFDHWYNKARQRTYQTVDDNSWWLSGGGGELGQLLDQQREPVHGSRFDLADLYGEGRPADRRHLHLRL